MCATLKNAQVLYPVSILLFHHHIFTNTNCGSSVDCKVGKWKAWGECSLTCGGGIKTKTREVIQQPNQRGEKCPTLEERDVCNTEECPGSLLILLFDHDHHIFTECGSSVDCKVGDWSAWSNCNVNCAGGIKTKTREVIQQPNHVGEKCPALKDTMVCNTDPCPGNLFPSGF